MALGNAIFLPIPEPVLDGESVSEDTLLSSRTTLGANVR
jgi:hypothetical protein